jgi:hypothetical protein
VQTERVTLLATREFKAFLKKEARRQGVSLSELVRSRCEQKPSMSEEGLASLTAEVAKSLAEAQAALKQGIDEAQAVLAELRSKRASKLKTKRSRVR